MSAHLGVAVRDIEVTWDGHPSLGPANSVFAHRKQSLCPLSLSDTGFSSPDPDIMAPATSSRDPRFNSSLRIEASFGSKVIAGSSRSLISDPDREASNAPATGHNRHRGRARKKVERAA